MDERIKAVMYFTAMDGVFGEAAASCEGDTQIQQIVYRDGEPYEIDLMHLTFCVIVDQTGRLHVGTAEKSRELAYENAFKKLEASASEVDVLSNAE